MDGNANQNKKYFEELAKIRTSSLNDVQKSILSNIKSNIVYDLLQNADNAQATYVIFELFKDKLVFKHNGKKHFTISNPTNEKSDLQNNKLGYVNSITSITKFNQFEPKIGQNGFGIKSFFEYTTTPLIYDTNFSFKIEQFVIPILLTEDYNGRKNDETIIVIPFNKPSKLDMKIYNEIAEKLKNLIYPDLFLKTISLITYTIDNKIQGKIEHNIELEMNYANIKVEFANYLHSKGDIQINQRFWIFSNLIKKYSISIAFLVDDEGYLKPLPPTNAFCFFQTYEMTNLNYIINAPFLLTTDRMKIKPNDPHNQLMITEIANLSAKSLMIFKDIGQKYNTQLINDNILSIFPTESFSKPDLQKQISFTPIYDEVLKVFQNEEIIPIENGFTSKKNAYWCSDSSLLDLISDEQLTILVNNPNAKWVFKSFTMPNIKSRFIISIVQNEICECTLFNKPKQTFKEKNNPFAHPWSSPKPLPSFIDCFKLISNEEDFISPFTYSEITDVNSNCKISNNSKNSNNSYNSYNSKNSNNSDKTKNVNSSKATWGSSFSSNKVTKGWGTTVSKPSANPFMNKTSANNANSEPKKDDNNKDDILFKGISKEFIEKQSFEWLNKFYKWIGLKSSRIEMAKTSPIFIDQNRKGVSAYNSQLNKLQLFFPVIKKEDLNYSTVHPILFKNEENFIFMREIGISVPLNIKDQIYKIIIPQCNNINNKSIDEFVDYFKKVIFYFQFCSIDERSSFIEDLKNTDLLLFTTKENKTIQRGKPSTLYFPNKILIDFFDSIPQTRFICFDKYKDIFGKNKESDVSNFLVLLGVRKDISLVEEQVSFSDLYKYKIDLPYSTGNYNCKEIRIEGFDAIWETIQKDHSKSIILWNILLHLSRNNLLDKFNQGNCEYFYHVDHTFRYPSIFRQKLINEKWLITSKNEFVSPNEIFLIELPKEFNIDDPAVIPLSDFLNIKKRKVEILTKEYINDHDFVERAKKAGLFEKFLKELETKETGTKK